MLISPPAAASFSIHGWSLTRWFLPANLYWKMERKQSCRDQISGIRYQKNDLWHYQYSDWSTHFCRDSTSEWGSVRGLSLIRRRVNSLSLSSVLETNELTTQALCPGRGQLHTMIPIAFCTPTMRNCAFFRGLKLFQRPWTRQPGLTASTRWVSRER